MIIKFEIDKKHYEIQEISIRNYYQIKTDLLLNQIDAKYKIISVLSGCPIEILKDLTLQSWNEIWVALEVMIDNSLKREIRMINQFRLEDVDYGLVTFDDMTIGEFADLDTIISADNADNRVHEILAILYRPIVSRKWKKNIIEKYDLDGFKYRSELFMDLPVSYAKSAASFFLSIGQASLKATGIFSIQNPNPEEKKMQEITHLLLGLGTRPSLSSLEEIRLKSEELQSLVSERHSTSLPFKKTKSKEKSKPIKWLSNIIK